MRMTNQSLIENFVQMRGWEYEGFNMTKYIANCHFYKDIEHDYFEHVCRGDIHPIDFQSIQLEFTTQSELIEKMADYVSGNYDVAHDRFCDYVSNDCDINRFSYAQNENDDGDYIELSKECPKGWYASYQILVISVSQIEDVEFPFTLINNWTTQKGTRE